MIAKTICKFQTSYLTEWLELKTQNKLTQSDGNTKTVYLKSGLSNITAQGCW